MIFQDWNFPDDLFYDRHHQWVRPVGDLLVLGINDYLQSTAGDFLYVHLPTVGSRTAADESFSSVESGKWVGRIYAPVSGVVVAINESLEGNPSALNQDSYGSGWLVKIRPDEANWSTGLLSGEDYREWLARELAAEAQS